MISSAPARVAQRAEQLVEPGRGRHHAHVRRAGLGDHAGDLVAARREQRPSTASASLYGSTTVSAADAPVTPGVSGRPSVATPGPGRDQQRVDVAVVAAGELHHERPAGVAAGQAERGHRGLGAGVDQPDLLDRGPRDDLRGQLDLAGRGRAERRPARQRRRHRRRPRPGARARGSSAPRSRPGRRTAGRPRRTGTGPRRAR